VIRDTQGGSASCTTGRTGCDWMDSSELKVYGAPAP
jgi:hypothetical protein